MKRTQKTPPPVSMTPEHIPPEMTAQALESGALGLKVFIDLGWLVMKRDKPMAYRDACEAIASGAALETIVVRIRPDSVLLSMCLLAPESKLPPALFSIQGRALAETVN